METQMKLENITSIDMKSPMRFQARDTEILQCIQDCGGIMAKRQLRAIFWEGKSVRAMEKRLAKLHHQRYIEWPDLHQRRRYPIPEPVVWLEWRGALQLAGIAGIYLKPLSTENENQKRELHRELRTQGFHWLREPRWSQLLHDLTVVDVRLMLQRYAQAIPHLSIEEWRQESEFRAQMDVVDIQVRDRQGKLFRRKKGVCPDGMFSLIDQSRRAVGLYSRARFLLEIDMATHDNTSFGWEKALPGAAYIQSKVFHARFGNNYGHWLVITTSETRMHNLMLQTAEKARGDAGLFLFTTFPSFFSQNALKEKIWRKCEMEQGVGLLEEREA
jgi:hypothetical protein